MTRGIRLVFARRLRFTAVPPRAGGNPSTSKYATWLSVGKASGNTAVAPPSTLMVGSKCKYQNVLSFFFLSLSFCSLLDEVLCVGGSSSSSVLPSSPSSLPTFLFLTWLNYFLNSSCHFVNCCGHFLPSLEYFPNRLTSASPSSSTF